MSQHLSAIEFVRRFTNWLVFLQFYSICKNILKYTAIISKSENKKDLSKFDLIPWLVYLYIYLKIFNEVYNNS